MTILTRLALVAVLSILLAPAAAWAEQQPSDYTLVCREFKGHPCDGKELLQYFRDFAGLKPPEAVITPSPPSPEPEENPEVQARYAQAAARKAEEARLKAEHNAKLERYSPEARQALVESCVRKYPTSRLSCMKDYMLPSEYAEAERLENQRVDDEKFKTQTLSFYRDKEATGLARMNARCAGVPEYLLRRQG